MIKSNKIVIVGGGSAGWMTAATLIKVFPNKDITLIESPNTPTVGVGESTLGHINGWMGLIGIKDEEFMAATDATYKMSIRFDEFYKKGAGHFHYPFGSPDFNGTHFNFNDWWFKKELYPETQYHDFAEKYFPAMTLVNNNKITDKLNQLKGWNFQTDTAYHFDATKFGLFLKSHHCLNKGVKYVVGHVTDVKVDDSGVKELILDGSVPVKADLFIDCTGFKSLLLAGALKEPFESYADFLPNNSAWATKIKYKDAKKEMVPYTNCHAIENGWCWEIPLWHRWGTGYVFSDKFVSDEDALVEFKNHIKWRFPYANPEELEYKNIKMRVGLHERTWVKNVCAIGLSAGFIEPLESNGLFTTHEFLFKLVKALGRDHVNKFDIDAYNMHNKWAFRNFAEFVGLHYALTGRDDTPYWKACQARNYASKGMDNLETTRIIGFQTAGLNKYYNNEFSDGGFPCIAAGMQWAPVSATDAIHNRVWLTEQDHKIMWKKITENLDKKVGEWESMIKDCPNYYDYMKEKFHND